jgi:hypothetical protein
VVLAGQLCTRGESPLLPALDGARAQPLPPLPGRSVLLRVTRPYAYLTMAILGSNLIGAPLAAGFLLLDGKGGLRGWQVRGASLDGGSALSPHRAPVGAAGVGFLLLCAAATRRRPLSCFHPPPCPPSPHLSSQWLFLLEGLPSILLGVIVFWRLPSSIATARFLTPAEREALAAEVARDHVDDPAPRSFKASLALLRMALHNRYLYPLFAAGLMASIAAASYVAYTPIIVNSLLEGKSMGAISVAAAQGSSTWKPVLLSMVPYAIGVALTFVVGHISQRCNEQFYPIAACMGASGVLIALFVPLARAHPAAGFVALAGSLAGSFAGQGPGLALIARLSWGRESVVAQPLTNTFNLVGAILGPIIVGALLSTSVSGARSPDPHSPSLHACRSTVGTGRPTHKLACAIHRPALAVLPCCLPRHPDRAPPHALPAARRAGRRASPTSASSWAACCARPPCLCSAHASGSCTTAGCQKEARGGAAGRRSCPA